MATIVEGSTFLAFNSGAYFFITAFHARPRRDPLARMIVFTSCPVTFVPSSEDSLSARLCVNENPAFCKIGIGPNTIPPIDAPAGVAALVSRSEEKPTGSEQAMPGAPTGNDAKLLTKPLVRTVTGTKQPCTFCGIWITIWSKAAQHPDR